MGFASAFWDTGNDWTGFVTSQAQFVGRSRQTSGLKLRDGNGRLINAYTGSTPNPYTWYIIRNTTALRTMRVSFGIRFQEIRFSDTKQGPFFITPRDDGGNTIGVATIRTEFKRKGAAGLLNDTFWIQPTGDNSQRVDIEDMSQRWFGFYFLFQSSGTSEPYDFDGRILVHDLTPPRPRLLGAWTFADPTGGQIFDFAQFRFGVQSLNTIFPNGPETFEWRVDEYRQHTFTPSGDAREPAFGPMPRNRYGPYATAVL